jgi:hypothetical protein
MKFMTMPGFGDSQNNRILVPNNAPRQQVFLSRAKDAIPELMAVKTFGLAGMRDVLTLMACCSLRPVEGSEYWAETSLEERVFPAIAFAKWAAAKGNKIEVPLVPGAKLNELYKQMQQIGIAAEIPIIVATALECEFQYKKELSGIGAFVFWGQ